MTDDEIEFLDEDADIVQQCVQFVPLLEPKLEPVEEEDESSLMVVKQPPQRERISLVGPPAKRRKKEDDDSDYDPDVDSQNRNRKRRAVQRSKPFTKYVASGVCRRSASPSEDSKPALALELRRKMDIRIPDFDDPLCLPVRALVKDENDSRRLRNWNHVCLEQMKRNETPLRPRDGPVVSSNRTVVIRNLLNKCSGKTETTFLSKTTVQSASGATRIETIQSVLLPRWRECSVPPRCRLARADRPPLSRRWEALLAPHADPRGDALLVYKPDEALAMVFRMFEGGGESERRYLREIASCSSCARCYHTSWRGAEADDKQARCPLCARSLPSARALIAHARSHPRDRRALVARTLAQLLPHQYRCRVCQQRFSATRELRRHLLKHKGPGEFHCEVGDHTVS